jgi:hypothetical protein
MLVLNDMILFPSALLSEHICWEAIDDNSARVSLTNAGMTVSAVVYFNEHNDVVNFVADRYRMEGKSSIKTRWSTPFSSHQEINGIRIPTQAEVIWHLPEAPFSYLRASVVDIQYNVFSRYK